VGTLQVCQSAFTSLNLSDDNWVKDQPFSIMVLVDDSIVLGSGCGHELHEARLVIP
jgi:hypothetical protein